MEPIIHSTIQAASFQVTLDRLLLLACLLSACNYDLLIRLPRNVIELFTIGSLDEQRNC